MTPEEKSLLERTYKLTEENNKILHGLRRSVRWYSAYKVIYWVFIIGLSVGAFYVFQPYLNTLLSYMPALKDILKTLPN